MNSRLHLSPSRITGYTQQKSRFASVRLGQNYNDWFLATNTESVHLLHVNMRPMCKHCCTFWFVDDSWCTSKADVSQAVSLTRWAVLRRHACRLKRLQSHRCCIFAVCRTMLLTQNKAACWCWAWASCIRTWHLHHIQYTPKALLTASLHGANNKSRICTATVWISCNDLCRSATELSRLTHTLTNSLAKFNISQLPWLLYKQTVHHSAGLTVEGWKPDMICQTS